MNIQQPYGYKETMKQDKVTGKFISYRYDTKKIYNETVEKMKNGESDTDIAKWLLVDKKVLLYSTVRVIQLAKKHMKAAAWHYLYSVIYWIYEVHLTSLPNRERNRAGLPLAKSSWLL